MFINPWINTRTYYINKIQPVSFIENLASQFSFILKGNSSRLWDIIVSTGDYNIAQDFAQKVGINLNSFFLELKDNGIINVDTIDTFPSIKKKYINFAISKSDKNYGYYELLQENLLLRNKFLNILFFNLSYKCNLNCKHCYNPKNNFKDEILFSDAKRIIDELYERGLYSVIMTGGECTICKDFLEIAKYIRTKYIALNILTNGQKLYDDNEFFEKLLSMYPNLIQLSLYSMNPQIHDNITGVKGSHYKTLNIIKKLREKNIKTTIACFKTSYNKDCCKEVEEFANSIGADFYSDYKFINNINNNNICAKIDYEYIKENYKITKQRKINKKTNQLICNASIDRIAIAPNLDVNPCNYVDYVLGNIKESSLKNILDNEVPKFQAKFIKTNLTECFNYDYCAYCEYCPTLVERGFLKKSQTLCEDAKAYKNALDKVICINN